MAYTINKYSGATLVVVQDGTVDTTTDLTFVGKNYAGYGEIQNENFLFLLENFSGTSQPPKPTSGQIWHDSTNGKIKFYDGTKFKTTGGAEVSTTQPVGLTSGDFWWDSGNSQLYTYNGSSFVLVGPQGAGSGLTQMKSQTVRDNANVNHSLIVATIDDEVIFTVSGQEFTIDATDPANVITGFDVIRKGTTMVNTKDATNGVTSGADPKHVYWGTSSNALRLGGLLPGSFVQSTPGTPTTFSEIVRFPDAGITIGDENDLHVYVENGNQGVIANEVGTNNIIRFKTSNANSVQTNSVTIQATGINPGSTSTYTLGSSIAKWSNVWADNFQGNSSSTSAIKFNSADYAGDTSAIASTTALRDSAGDLHANFFRGTATQAQYADLAEVYATAEELPTGTVVAVGGTAEVRPAKVSDLAIGVISAEPAYLMNSTAEGQAVGLKGRVPVRVSGPVSKGQAVYAWDNGVASTIASNGLVGVALETSTSEEEKLIECVLKV
jgi:hypothetical protein